MIGVCIPVILSLRVYFTTGKPKCNISCMVFTKSQFVVTLFWVQTPEALQAIASTMFLAFTKLVEPFVGDACADPTFLFCQRWGHAYAATPLCLRDKCEVDGSHQFAMCGDFCHNGGVEGAALSALAAARLLQTVL